MGEELVSASGDSKIRIDLQVTCRDMELSVVSGEIKGTGGGDRMFVVGAHHDTCYHTLGGADNTAGVLNVLELATQLSRNKPSTNVRFVTFGGEEEGLYGSEEYFAAHANELRSRTIMYCNFDMPNVVLSRNNAVTLTTSINSTIPELEDLGNRVIASDPALSKYTMTVEWDDGNWSGSDQYAFAAAGIDCTNSWGSGNREYHTYLDDLSVLNEESGAIGARVFGSYILGYGA